MTNDVIVVGAGVTGLTCAVQLAETGRAVRVISRDQGAGTTSSVAGGLCWPYRILPEEAAVEWSVRGYEALAGLAETEGTGVRMVTGTMAAASVPDRWRDAVPGLRAARPEELPAGIPEGLRARTPLVAMDAHLQYLERRLAAAGGTLERRAADSLDALAQEAGAVVNCSGLGARELVPDPDVRPVQGQLVIVENPGIEEWFVDADGHADTTTYVLPQPYGVVLGGTAVEGAWSTEPDPAVAEAIVARCVRVHPALADARILAHRVGLRPARPAVRLEAERLPGGGLCVHNYGHGGAGVTVAWGCADEVVRLLDAAV
ncbi:FAD-dependent oxidoreductase [Streptomyces purpurogeneiscleroticus]|uniref:FAD-dependent oxidoreductase n=1 Tax=Streptomyces purpurogeneiscleroticus TaxID=68259 RepID=UPI001CBB7A26|nr:FAD-dependent oxidoreductase [Streptomyces purpurogeneiscleroticus]MBZ4017517.1 amino acid oxidase [Streptomyces purpurogeneiscleroticus]